MENSIVQTAREYACKCHRETNHLYNGRDYSVHLLSVYSFGMKYIRLVPAEFQQIVLAACWTHDVIEDCRQTYNDVISALSDLPGKDIFQIADITYALTNEKGKNRKERANEKYYKGIIDTPYAPFVKLCDRLANVEYSKTDGGKMMGMYRKEQDQFVRELWSGKTMIYEPMFQELEHLIDN